MMLQSLIPGMEYGENADASTEAVSIGGDLHQGLGDSTKQQSVDKTLVSECECSPLLGQGEDDMAVGHGQQTRRLLLQPAIASGRLALWAVAITA
jgi:hypothetical protein